LVIPRRDIESQNETHSGGDAIAAPGQGFLSSGPGEHARGGRGDVAVSEGNFERRRARGLGFDGCIEESRRVHRLDEGSRYNVKFSGGGCGAQDSVGGSVRDCSLEILAGLKLPSYELPQVKNWGFLTAERILLMVYSFNIIFTIERKPENSPMLFDHLSVSITS
jgi:hypothetical protein